jgi:hypothetical protein
MRVSVDLYLSPDANGRILSHGHTMMGPRRDTMATVTATLLALLMAAPVNQPVCVGNGPAQECAVKTAHEVTFLSCVRTGAHQQICNKR